MMMTTSEKLVADFKSRFPTVAEAPCVEGGTIADAFGRILSNLDAGMLSKVRLRDEHEGDRVMARLVRSGDVRAFPSLSSSWEIDFMVSLTDKGRAMAERLSKDEK